MGNDNAKSSTCAGGPKKANTKSEGDTRVTYQKDAVKPAARHENKADSQGQILRSATSPPILTPEDQSPEDQTWFKHSKAQLEETSAPKNYGMYQATNDKVLPLPDINREASNHAQVFEQLVDKNVLLRSRNPAEFALNILALMALTPAQRLVTAKDLLKLPAEKRDQYLTSCLGDIQDVWPIVDDYMHYFDMKKVRVVPAYAYLQSFVDANSLEDNMDQGKLALKMFNRYTFFTVKAKKSYYGGGERYLAAVIRSRESQITGCSQPVEEEVAKWNAETKKWKPSAKDGKVQIDIANYGMACYAAEYKISHFQRIGDPTAPVVEGDKGVVQVAWTGRIIEDSPED